MEKVHKCRIKREIGYLYFIDGRGNCVRFHSQSKRKEIICPNDGAFTKEPGWMYFLDRDGDISRTRLKSFKEYAELRDGN